MQNPLSTFVNSTPLNQADLLWLCFYIATFLFILHALIVGYHWLTFGTNRGLSTTAVAIYVAVGSLILLTIATTISLTT